MEIWKPFCCQKFLTRMVIDEVTAEEDMMNYAWHITDAWEISEMHQEFLKNGNPYKLNKLTLEPRSAVGQPPPKDGRLHTNPFVWAHTYGKGVVEGKLWWSLTLLGGLRHMLKQLQKKKRIYKTLPTFVVIGTPFEKREDGTILIGDNEAVKTRDFVYFTRAEHKFQATKPDPCNPKKRIPRDAIFSFNANNLDNEKEPEKKHTSSMTRTRALTVGCKSPPYSPTKASTKSWVNPSSGRHLDNVLNSRRKVKSSLVINLSLFPCFPSHPARAAKLVLADTTQNFPRFSVDSASPDLVRFPAPVNCAGFGGGGNNVSRSAGGLPRRRSRGTGGRGPRRAGKPYFGPALSCT